MENTIQTLLAQGRSEREIQQDLGISRGTVRRKKAKIQSGQEGQGYHRDKKLDAYREIIKELIDKEGLTAVLVHQRLERHHQLKISYPTVRRYVADLHRTEIFVPLHCEPGEEAQVDFGYVGLFEHEGRQVKVWLFCMVLSFSRYAYYELVLDQRAETFIGCHIHAFEFFGGVAAKIKLDNLKAGVLEPNWYEPLLQQQYSEFLLHYGGAGIPCRIYRPQDKGKVESGVKYGKNNFIRGLTHRQLTRARQELRQWIEETCNRRVHGTTHQVPAKVFQEVEREVMLPLPVQRYEIWHTEQRTVHKQGHVVFRYNYYSVPWRLEPGEEVLLKSNEHLLRIFKGATEVAVHTLLSGRGQYQTRTEHLPPEKQPKGEDYYRQKLAVIGTAALGLLDALLAHDTHHWKEKVRGILSLQRHYPPEQIEQACQRALEYGSYSYLSVKNICQRKLAPLPPPEPLQLGGWGHDLQLYDQLTQP